MAFQIDVYALFQSKAECKTASTMLSLATQPDFIEDVEVGWQDFFIAVGELSEPVTIRCEGKLLYLHWYESITEFRDVQHALTVAGADIACAYCVNDGADAADEPEDGHDPIDGYFYLGIESQLVNVTQALLNGQKFKPQLPKLDYRQPEETLKRLLNFYKG